MSPCLPNIWREKKYSCKKIYLVIVGLDNAGKTTIAHSIQRVSSEVVVPTIGFDLTRFKLDHYNVTLYDLGGRDCIRDIWQHYFAEIHGLIFVIDSGDADRLDESRRTLFQVLSHAYITGKPVLLLANKQDLADAFSESKLTETFNLDRLIFEHNCPYKIQPCCAFLQPKRKLDPRIQSGLQWLLSNIESSFFQLEERIRADLDKQTLQRNGINQLRENKIESLQNQDTDSSSTEEAKSIPVMISHRDSSSERKMLAVASLPKPLPSSGFPRQARRLSKVSPALISRPPTRNSMPTPKQRSSKLPILTNEHIQKQSRSTRSLDCKLPPIHSGHPKRYTAANRGNLSHETPVLPLVDLHNRKFTEAIEIEEFDEDVDSYRNLMKTASPFVQKMSGDVCTMSEVDESLLFKRIPKPTRPRSRKIAPLSTQTPFSERGATTPSQVFPINGGLEKAVKDPKKVHPKLNTEQLPKTLCVKRPSPLARIFNSTVHIATQVSKSFSDGEQ